MDFNPNDRLDGDVVHQTYDLIGGIFHGPTGGDLGHYTAVCSIDDNSDKWITCNDTIFETNKFLNEKKDDPYGKGMVP